jgi:hypothetical protein
MQAPPESGQQGQLGRRAPPALRGRLASARLVLLVQPALRELDQLEQLGSLELPGAQDLPGPRGQLERLELLEQLG